jgi:hypothetical protein
MKFLTARPQAWIIAALLLLVAGSSGLFVGTADAQFTSPPGRGRPKGTAGGGSRPNRSFCLQNPNHPENFVALAPTQSIGFTTQDSPTIWVYIPNTIAKTLEFSLFSDKQEGVYQTTIPVTSSGLLAIPLPPNQVKLVAGRSYSWAAALVCDPLRRSQDWLAEGEIQYQSPNAELQRQLMRASVEQQVKLYLQAGFWYEALNLCLELKRSHLDHASLTKLWGDLLKSAGLPAIALSPPITTVTK